MDRKLLLLGACVLAILGMVLWFARDGGGRTEGGVLPPVERLALPDFGAELGTVDGEGPARRQGAGIDPAGEDPAPNPASAASGLTNALEVVVLDAETRLSVAEALVRVELSRPFDRDEEASLLEGLTDGEGRVRFEAEPGSLNICAWTPGGRFGSAVGSNELGRATRIQVEVLALATLRGIVRDGRTRAPIGGARISNPVSSSLGRVEELTDAGGRFEFALWQQGVLSNLVVRAEGYGQLPLSLIVDPSLGWARVRNPAELEWNPSEPFLEIELLPQRSIRGRVVLADGSPVPGARVEAHGRVFPSDWIAVPDQARAESDGEGSFELAGLSSDVPRVVVCEVPELGHALRVVPATDLAGDLGSIELVPPARVRGTLAGPGGLALAGARVEVHVDLRSLLAESGAELPPGAVNVVLRAEERIAAGGAFDLECAASPEARLVARLGGAEIASRTLRLPPGAVHDLGLIDAHGEFQLVESRLLDEGGEPLPERELHVLGFGDRSWARVRTAHDGRFAVAVRPDPSLELTVVLLDPSGRQRARWTAPIQSFPRALRLER